MKFNFEKQWCFDMAQLENGCDVSAGRLNYMPIRELYCEKCKRYYEIILITESDKKHFDTDTHFCDKCGTEVKKVLSQTGKGVVK